MTLGTLATALAVLIVVLALGTTGNALEKSSSRLVDDRDEWRSGNTSCSIIYYNTCTGWIWIWSGWSPDDRYGVHFWRGFPNFNANLMNTWVHFSDAAPSGYGFTGSIDVWRSDLTGCLVGSPLASTPLLPQSSWNQIDFSAGGGVSVPKSFAITYTVSTAASADPHSVSSDHPAAGPTGVAACGSCYPTTRVNHTYYYGSAARSLCPGSSLNDTVCDAHLLWDAQVLYLGVPGADCGDFPLAIEERSWGTIKALYR